MNSGESDLNLFTARKKTTRRAFITKSAGCTAALTLLPFSGIIAEVLAVKGDKSKEEIHKELEEKVEKYMGTYGTCSQASFCALNEQFELKADEITPALKLFAGGIAGKMETCGAVTGSLLAQGKFFAPQDKKEYAMLSPSIKFASLFFDRFTEEFGSTRCSKVVEHQFGRPFDFQNPDDMKSFMEAAKSGKCTEVVKNAVLIACDIILENS